MKQKLPTILILMVLALIGAAYWVDLAYYTDPVTDFVTVGTVWMRYAVLALPLLMALFGLRTVGPRAIAVMRLRSTPLAVMFAVAGLAGVVFGVFRLLVSFSPIDPFGLALGALFLWYGVWMALAAVQMYFQTAPSPTKSAVPGIFAALPFCALTIYRVLMNPTSLYRIAPVVSAFSALFAMLWFGMMLRSLYIALPRKRVRWMYLFGLAAFLFCTCLEMVQAVYFFIFLNLPAIRLLESLNMGVFGVLAAFVAVAIAGQDLAAPVKPNVYRVE